MRKILKGSEPDCLNIWKRRNPSGHYQDLTHNIRQTIRQNCLEEQFYLCAYCCEKIVDIQGCHNEHVASRALHPNLALEFSNIVASCNKQNQCGNAHTSVNLPITPLMEACENELRFKLSGRVEGLTTRAISTIEALKLGRNEEENRSLIEKRKTLSSGLLWSNATDPHNLYLLEEAEVRELIDVLSEPVDGRLESFAPVVVNILNYLLQDILQSDE